MLVCDAGELAVVARVGGDDAHVGGGGLDDDRGDVRPALGEHGTHGVEVVVGQDEGLGRRRRGDARRAGQRERREAGARLGEQSIGVAVVVAGELDEELTPRETAGEADRGHRGLGARRHEPESLDRGDAVDADATAHELGEFGLGGSRRTERQSARSSGLDGADDLGVRVAEDGGPPGADEVDVLAPLGVGDVRAGGRDHEPRGAADRAEGAHRRVDATGDRFLGLVEILLVGAHGDPFGGGQLSRSHWASSTAQ